MTRVSFFQSVLSVVAFTGIISAPLCAVASESPLDLLIRARANDSDYLAAAASRDAGLQARVAGRALLLPNFSVGYEIGNSELTRNYSNGASPVNYEASSRSLTWRLAQPIFSLERWASWRVEDTRSLLAELRFIEATTELTLRLVRAVFDTLLANDNLRLAAAQHNTLISQRKEVEKLREAGVTTLTEVEDTRARELSALAGKLEADFGLQMRRRELSRIVGEVSSDSLKPLAPTPLGPAAPDDLEKWLARVGTANPKIVSATTAVAMAEYVQAKAKGAHTPTLDLVASGTQTKDPNSFTAVERSGGVSLRLTVPIFEGGRTDAEVKRVFALREQAYQELRTARREAEVKTAEAFLGMANATGKSRALEQALHAAQTSLRGARIGRETGLRTHTEVLNAQQQVFTVERDLNKERYNHALAALQLKALAGDLVDADVADLTIKPVNEQ